MVEWIAIAVAVAAFWFSYSLQRRIVLLEEGREQVRKLSERKARLSAQIVDKELYIRNEGAATARNIILLLDGNPVTEHKWFISGTAVNNKIGAGEFQIIQLSISFSGCPRSADYLLTWEDDSGERGSSDGTLSF